LDQALLQLPIQIARPSRQSWYQRASRTLAAPARPMQPKGGTGSRVLPNRRAPTRRPSSPKAPRRRNVTSPGFPSGAAFRGKQTRRSSSPHGRSGTHRTPLNPADATTSSVRRGSESRPRHAHKRERDTLLQPECKRPSGH
jgi:hypothetical protein